MNANELAILADLEWSISLIEHYVLPATSGCGNHFAVRSRLKRMRRHAEDLRREVSETRTEQIAGSGHGN